MKQIDSTLLTFLTSGTSARRFDLFTFTLKSGAVYRWTDADVDIADGGYTYTRGPVIARGQNSQSKGLQVDTLTITLSGPDFMLGGTRLPVLATLGGLDGANVVQRRAFFGLNGSYKGSLIRFVGDVGSVTPNSTGAVLNLKSVLAKLQQKTPRGVYQAGCLNQLYDSNCGVSMAANTFTGTVSAVGSGSNPSLTISLASSVAAGRLVLGRCKFTGGKNAGLLRTIRSQTGSGASVVLAFARPFDMAVAVGDAVSITYGCDGQLTTCATQFNNLLRFRGQPFIPVPETTT